MKLCSIGEFSTFVETVVKVVSVIVVRDTRDPEEHPEPVDHVPKHRTLELRKEEKEYQLVDLETGQVEADTFVDYGEEHLMEKDAEKEGNGDGLEYSEFVPY